VNLDRFHNRIRKVCALVGAALILPASAQAGSQSQAGKRKGRIICALTIFGSVVSLAPRTIVLGILVLTTLARECAWGQPIAGVDARVVATHIPGPSAIAQVGTFINGGTLTPGDCANPSPIPTKFLAYVQPGAILDPTRLLVGSASNFGAPLPASGGREGSLLSIDPTGSATLVVPADFDRKGDQEATLDGAVQMFSANSPHWLNGVNNPSAFTAQYAGVGNPLGLSNNNGFGRIWPANSPFGLDREGSSSILDPTGLPLNGAPNPLIGGVYVGKLTNRNLVTNPAQPQVVLGSLNNGGVGTALLGPSPDGTCKAVFAVLTANGAIVQEHTLKGLDGLAPRGTVRPILGGDGKEAVEPRFGVIMNPYTNSSTVVRQLFVSEPFYNTITVVDLVIVGTAPNQVFGLGSVTRIGSPALNLPVDLTPVERDRDNPNWASNSTLDNGSDFYVANAGDNTIVRMRQDGTVVAIRRVMVNGRPLDDVSLNGIAASADATDTMPPTTIFATFVDPSSGQGGVLAMPAF
jgi:hypothetical protein